MKKVAIALISIVTLSMMLMAISPVMAKPGYVTIVVKDANNKPVPNVCVRIWQAKTPTAGPVSTLIRTNDRGKAVIPLNENFGTTYLYNEVQVGETILTLVPCGTVDLNKKLSGRAVVTYPPSA